jgi:hypothetical protein
MQSKLRTADLMAEEVVKIIGSSVVTSSDVSGL